MPLNPAGLSTLDRGPLTPPSPRSRRPIVVAADGDQVVSLIHEDFTVRATGKRVVTTAVHHFTLGHDGLVVRYRPIVDSAWEAGFRTD